MNGKGKEDELKRMEDARKYVESLRQDMEKFDLEDQKKERRRGEDDEKVKPLPPPKKPIRKESEDIIKNVEKLAYVPPRQLPYGKRKTMNEILSGKGTDLDAIGRQSRTCRELAERYVFYKVLPKYFRDKGYKVFVEIENEPCFYIRKSSASAPMLSVVWENAATEDNPDGEACKAWDVAVYDYSGTKEPLICISIKGSMDSGTPVDLTADEWALAQNKKTDFVLFLVENLSDSNNLRYFLIEDLQKLVLGNKIRYSISLVPKLLED